MKIFTPFFDFYKKLCYNIYKKNKGKNRMKYYFYCPRCKHKKYIEKIPHGAVGNIRDGWGRPISHFECPICHNLDAGAMQIINDDQTERDYIEYVIKLYQHIRTKDW